MIDDFCGKKKLACRYLADGLLFPDYRSNLSGYVNPYLSAINNGMSNLQLVDDGALMSTSKFPSISKSISKSARLSRRSSSGLLSDISKGFDLKQEQHCFKYWFITCLEFRESFIRESSLRYVRDLLRAVSFDGSAINHVSKENISTADVIHTQSDTSSSAIIIGQMEPFLLENTESKGNVSSAGIFTEIDTPSLESMESKEDVHKCCDRVAN